MTFETLKRSHLKRNIIIALIAIGIISAIVLNFTKAKYRTTESIPLIQGTINFSPSDFNMVAVYLNKGSETLSADKVPHVGYTLNEEQSTCESPDGVEDSIGIEYIQPSLTFSNVIKKGTKCSVYFDLIPDSEKPTINNVYSSTDDSSITVTIDASDNIGIYYYYFKLDENSEIQAENNTYRFDGLNKGDIHTITVRVEDAAGNEAISNKNVTVGLTAKDVILANEGGVVTIEEKGEPDFNSMATTDEGMYAAADDYGTSYYYRGALNDNWLYFAGFYWRIIRINGNGSIRIIYSGISTEISGANNQINGSTYSFSNAATDNMYVGYMYTSGEAHGTGTNSNAKTEVDKWYVNNLLEYTDYLDGNTGFCGDRTPYSGTGIGASETNYAALNRLVTNKNPNLQCTNVQDLYTTNGSAYGNQSLTYPIGLIAADEVAMAGEAYSNSSNHNTKYYLYTGQRYWTMTPYQGGGSYGYVFLVFNSGGYLNMDGYPTNKHGIRPVINLKADIALSGTGTTTDPFVLNTTN